MEALVGQKGNFEFNPVLDRKPMERFEDGCDVVVLLHAHQDPSSTVLNVLQLLDVLAWDPDEECVAIVQPGGDKGVDEFFAIGESEYGAENCNVPEVKEGGFTKMFNVGLRSSEGLF